MSSEHGFGEEVAGRACLIAIVLFAVPVLLLGFASGSLSVTFGLGVVALAIAMGMAAMGMTPVGKKFFFLFLFLFGPAGFYMPIVLDTDFLDLASVSVTTGLLVAVIASLLAAWFLQSEKPSEGHWHHHGWHQWVHNPEQCFLVALFLFPNCMVICGAVAAHGLPALVLLPFGFTLKGAIVAIFVVGAAVGLMPGFLFTPLLAETIFEHEE